MLQIITIKWINLFFTNSITWNDFTFEILYWLVEGNWKINEIFLHATNFINLTKNKNEKIPSITKKSKFSLFYSTDRAVILSNRSLYLRLVSTQKKKVKIISESFHQLFKIGISGKKKILSVLGACLFSVSQFSSIQNLKNFFFQTQKGFKRK